MRQSAVCPDLRGRLRGRAGIRMPEDIGLASVRMKCGRTYCEGSVEGVLDLGRVVEGAFWTWVDLGIGDPALDDVGRRLVQAASGGERFTCGGGECTFSVVRKVLSTWFVSMPSLRRYS